MSNDYSNGYYKVTPSKSKDRPFQWNLFSPSHKEPILTATAQHATLGQVLREIDMAKANCQDDANYERKVDSRDRPYFIFKIGNDPIAKSEPYEGGKGAMENGIKSCKKNGPSELVVDKDLKEISTNEENVTTEEPDTSQTNNTYA